MAQDLVHCIKGIIVNPSTPGGKSSILVLPEESKIVVRGDMEHATTSDDFDDRFRALLLNPADEKKAAEPEQNWVTYGETEWPTTKPESDMDIMEKIHQVVPRLYISGITGAADVDRLKRLGITHVVSLAPEYYKDGKSNKRLQQHGIFHHKYELDDRDDADLLTIADQVHILLRGLADTSVLVHCAAGISRSASVIIYHLMETRYMGYDEALALVKKARPIVQPCPGFTRKLRTLESKYKWMYYPGELWPVRAHLPPDQQGATAEAELDKAWEARLVRWEEQNRERKDDDEDPWKGTKELRSFFRERGVDLDE